MDTDNTETYDHRLDLLDFAQEFLRRNLDYQRQFTQSAKASSLARREMARSWGLEFPGAARSSCIETSRNMARAGRAVRSNPC